MPNNWRPISLQPTIYKVYAAILARRLASWDEKISKSQKGFLPFEGCFEHSFIMQSILQDSKRRKRNAQILWLDLKNAFGSVPHETMWKMLERLSVPSHFVAICKEIFTGSSLRICCKEGFTGDIPVKQGIKQGCPLSPLLFNLVLEGVLPELESDRGGYKWFELQDDVQSASVYALVVGALGVWDCHDKDTSRLVPKSS